MAEKQKTTTRLTTDEKGRRIYVTETQGEAAKDATDYQSTAGLGAAAAKAAEARKKKAEADAQARAVEGKKPARRSKKVQLDLLGRVEICSNPACGLPMDRMGLWCSRCASRFMLRVRKATNQ